MAGSAADDMFLRDSYVLAARTITPKYRGAGTSSDAAGGARRTALASGDSSAWSGDPLRTELVLNRRVGLDLSRGPVVHHSVVLANPNVIGDE
jgi:hypothetical protein